MCQFHEPSRLVVGTKQTIRALSEKKVLELYIAEDADEFLKSYCGRHGRMRRAETGLIML